VTALLHRHLAVTRPAGGTPLMLAAARGNEACVRALLGHSRVRGYLHEALSSGGGATHNALDVCLDALPARVEAGDAGAVDLLSCARALLAAGLKPSSTEALRRLLGAHGESGESGGLPVGFCTLRPQLARALVEALSTRDDDRRLLVAGVAADAHVLAAVRASADGEEIVAALAPWWPQGPPEAAVVAAAGGVDGGGGAAKRQRGSGGGGGAGSARKISKKTRLQTWDKYIGKAHAQFHCLCCKANLIRRSKGGFHAGHVTAHADGGPGDVENLRPICAACNSDMGTRNMRDYHFDKGYADLQLCEPATAVHKKHRCCCWDRCSTEEMPLQGQPPICGSWAPCAVGTVACASARCRCCSMRVQHTGSQSWQCGAAPAAAERRCCKRGSPPRPPRRRDRALVLRVRPWLLLAPAPLRRRQTGLTARPVRGYRTSTSGSTPTGAHLRGPLARTQCASFMWRYPCALPGSSLAYFVPVFPARALLGRFNAPAH
jgi:hypothetical protein